MWIIAGILVVGILFIVLEVPPLWRNKQKKELWVFSLLLLFGIGLSIAESLDLNIPNPLDWISVIYKPLNDLIIGLLK